MHAFQLKMHKTADFHLNQIILGIGFRRLSGKTYEISAFHEKCVHFIAQLRRHNDTTWHYIETGRGISNAF